MALHSDQEKEAVFVEKACYGPCVLGDAAPTQIGEEAQVKANERVLELVDLEILFLLLQRMSSEKINRLTSRLLISHKGVKKVSSSLSREGD